MVYGHSTSALIAHQNRSDPCKYPLSNCLALQNSQPLKSAYTGFHIQSRSLATPLSNLSSLFERDESPENGFTTNIDALISSPVAPPNTSTTQSRFNRPPSAAKTPQTAPRLYPSLEEMHLSKVQQSTIVPNLGSRNVDLRAPPTSSTAFVVAEPQKTPSKSENIVAQSMTSPSFDFSLERPESDLSAEAQKIMDSVRGEAAKIKAQMLEERSRQQDKDGETDPFCGIAGRQINKPKGRSGRYSNVHNQEFKKMDSIAGHVSMWKNKMQENTSSLKRSPSKAGLDQPEKPLQRTKSFKSFGFNESPERLENSASTKRAKQNYGDDTATARPVSRDANSSIQTMPAKIPTKTGLPSAVTTPTKASLARSASVRSIKTSMIPSLSRSASTKTLNSPTMPRTEGSNKYASSLARFGSMKSILHRSQPKFSSDPTKVADGTHLPLPQGVLDVERDFPKIPDKLSLGLQRTPTIKRVGFTLTPDVRPQKDPPCNAPSPSKIPTPHTEPQPEVSTSPPINTDPIKYPVLTEFPHITIRPQIPRASTPGDFTFRASKTISFSPSKDAGITSPGSTIRHVRPSSIPTHVPKFDSLPAIPHGMPNKKRSRPEPDTENEDWENVDPMGTGGSDEDQPCVKKQRMSASPEKSLSPVKSSIPKIDHAKGKGKKGISLGRLNMLARPKKH